MTRPIPIDELLAVLECERAFVEECIEHGVLERADAYLPDDLERVRVTHTLVRELEINWPGVEVILRLRQDLVATRRTLGELIALVRERDAAPR